MGAHIRIPPPHRRAAIEAEIEMHLHRVTLLLARLDRADAPHEDLEDDDPAGGNILDEAHDDDPSRMLPVLPRYAVDQSAGPINEREGERAWHKRMMAG